MLKRILTRMLTVGVAFLIFGIVDNGIMIFAGNAIDGYLGATLGVSVLLSAGLGNTISDVAGILVGRIVEARLFRGRDITEGLSTIQIVSAEAVGITLGCLIGLAPLLII